jgi:hypothetical protein
MTGVKMLKERKMPEYMVLWIRIDDGTIARVTDDTNPLGDAAQQCPKDLKSPLNLTGFMGTVPISTFGTHASPGCRYVEQGGRYRWVCE